MRPRYARQWEANARLDPLWAILTRAGGPWSEAEFFATGEEEIARVLAFLEGAGLAPARRRAFLDFGCGVGRVTAALARRFESGAAVDVSATMIEHARRHLAGRAPHVRLAVNPATDLALLGDARFSLVYAHMVLQHLAPADQARYVAALLRVLEPGGVAALQTVEEDAGPRRPPSLRALVPRRLRRLLRSGLVALGARAGPARPEVAMHLLAAPRMGDLIAAAGCRVLVAPYTNSASADHRGRVEFFDRAEALRRVGTGQADHALLARFYFVGRPGAG